MRQPSPRAKGWLRKYRSGEVTRKEIPPEFYQTVMTLNREADKAEAMLRKAQARLSRILEGR